MPFDLEAARKFEEWDDHNKTKQLVTDLINEVDRLTDRTPKEGKDDKGEDTPEAEATGYRRNVGKKKESEA